MLCSHVVKTALSKKLVGISPIFRLCVGFSKCSFATMGPKGQLDLTGIYPPIITPFKGAHAEQIDYDKLNENFQKWADKGFAGYVVMGSNGEFPYLSREEKLQLISATRRLTPADKLLIAGAGCESTLATIDLCRESARLGADAVLVITPCFYKGGMTEEALEKHYTAVADASPVPVILYSVPANTGLEISAELAHRLSQHSNIIGMKDSGGNIEKMSTIIEATKGQTFQMLCGSAGFLLPALIAGSVGGVAALANCSGEKVVGLMNEFAANGKSDKAQELQRVMVEPNLMVTRKYGVAALKHMMEKLGYYGGPVRAPLLPLNAEKTQEIEKVFADSNYLP